MNNVCQCLLQKFRESCGGGYKIFSLEELSECAPQGEPVSFDDIAQGITCLAELKYIDIKYSRGDMYCIAVLKDIPTEGDAVVIAGEAAANGFANDKKLYIICAALSFAGAFLGALIACAIFAAVR